MLWSASYVKADVGRAILLAGRFPPAGPAEKCVRGLIGPSYTES